MINYLDLFSGIGAFGKALTKLGIEYELVGFSEIDKWAIESYSAVHDVSTDLNLGDVSEIEIEDIPKTDMVTYGFPCFTGDTLVLTDKGYKQIKNVAVGERVLTHDNTFQKVERNIPQGVKEIWKIKSMNMHEVNTTENHPFYVRRKTKTWNSKKRKNERIFGKPHWVEVKDLTTQDYIGYAINKESNKPSWKGVYYNYGGREVLTNLLPIDDLRLWYLVGRYIGDGWVKRRSNRNNNISGIVITTSLTEDKEFEEKIGDLYHYTKSLEGSIYKYHFSNRELGEFMKQFGEGAVNKNIPTNILNLEVKYLKSIIDGIIDSDGSELPNGIASLTTVSETLAYSFSQAISKVYKRPFAIYKNKTSDKTIIEGREVNQRDTFIVRFSKTEGVGEEAFYEDGHLWFPIREIVNTGLEDEVFDLTVNRNHSFTANGCIVHNCQDVSIAGKQEGISCGTRSGLLFEAERIIEGKKPKYAIAENVKNLVGKRFKQDFDGLLERLDGYGYNNYWEVLNAKDYGIPQNRERVFIVSIRKDIDDGKFKFPKPQELELTLRDMLDDAVEDKYTITQERVESMKNSNFNQERTRIQDTNNICGTLLARDYKDPKLVKVREFKLKDERVRKIPEKYYMDNEYKLYNEARGNVIGEVDIKGTEQVKRIYDRNQYAPTLSTMQGGHREPKVISEHCGKYRIRKLTPLECWRLMGFEDGDYWKARRRLEEVFYNGNDRSNSQMYKQAGNSIVVNVLEEIFKELFKIK